MADIQFATADIRGGKKKKEDRRKKPQDKKYNAPYYVELERS